MIIHVHDCLLRYCCALGFVATRAPAVEIRAGREHIGDGAAWNVTVALKPFPTTLLSLANTTYMFICVALTAAGSVAPDTRSSRGARWSAPSNTVTKSCPACVENAPNVSVATLLDGAVMSQAQRWLLPYATPAGLARSTVPAVVIIDGVEHSDAVAVNVTSAVTPRPTMDSSEVNVTVMVCCVAVTVTGSAVPLAARSCGAEVDAPSYTLKKS